MAIHSIESSKFTQPSPPSAAVNNATAELRQPNSLLTTEKNGAAKSDQTLEASNKHALKPDSDTEASIAAAIEKLNKFVGGANAELQFTLDTDADLTVVKIMDKETKQLIRQFPSAEAVQIAKVLDKLQGLLIRDQA